MMKLMKNYEDAMNDAHFLCLDIHFGFCQMVLLDVFGNGKHNVGMAFFWFDYCLLLLFLLMFYLLFFFCSDL